MLLSTMSLLVLLGLGVLALVVLVVLVVSSRNQVDVSSLRPTPRPVAPTVLGSGEVQDLLRAGKKIEAIKRYRELTGQGLKESKDAVEAMEQGQAVEVREKPPASPARTITGELAIDDPELRSHLAADRPIEAIKRYRELTGLGLKESKDAIEALRVSRKS